MISGSVAAIFYGEPRLTLPPPANESSCKTIHTLLPQIFGLVSPLLAGYGPATGQQANSYLSFIAGCLFLSVVFGSGAASAAGEREAAADRAITRAEALQDVEQFFFTLRRVHPDLLAKVRDIDEYLKLRERTTQEIAGNADRDGKIALCDLASTLYYAAAFFRDGHTSVTWGFQEAFGAAGQMSPPPFLLSLAAGQRFPPLLLRYEDGGFFVESSDSAGLDGLEVVAVNRKPILEFLRPVLDRCSRETTAGRAERFTWNAGIQLFWYSLTHLYGDAESVELSLRDAIDQVREQTIRTVDAAGFLNCPRGRYGKLTKLQVRGTAVDFYDSDRIAHLIYPNFVLTDDEKGKIDRIFKEIKTRRSRELILDLRHNSGGRPEMREFIFSYLYDGKFTLFSKERLKLTRDLTTALGELDGLIVTVAPAEQLHPKPEAFFTGRTFLLVDSGAYSSASDFAAMFRDYRAGTIIGSETGGFPIGFGVVCSFRLAHSGIECDVSSRQLFSPKAKPGDDERGVLPGIPVNRESLRPYRTQEDPILALAMDHIKKSR